MKKEQTIIATMIAGAILVITLLALETLGFFGTAGSPQVIAAASQSAKTMATSSSESIGLVSIDFDDGFASAYHSGIPLLDQAGLKSTNYIITGYLGAPGYVSVRDVLTLQKNGHEIGAHTRSHPHLNILSESDQETEIAGSREDLQILGLGNATAFAYPYGNYNNLTKQLVRQAGFLSARSTDSGFNDESTNSYMLHWYGLNAWTTWPEIQSKIDQAVRYHKWLILVIHRVDEDNNLISIRHELLQQIVDYLLAKKIRVVTDSEAREFIQATASSQKTGS